MNLLKFRAWLKEERKMAKVLTINMSSDKLIEVMVDEGKKQWYYADEIKIMQFTGLFDDSGEKIYDSDFVEVLNASETQKSHTSQVFFTCDGVLIEPHPVHKAIGLGKPRALSDYCDYGFGGKYSVSCRIIGNGYNNPKLMEASDE